jgi:hypothetical protein
MKLINLKELSLENKKILFKDRLEKSSLDRLHFLTNYGAGENPAGNLTAMEG